MKDENELDSGIQSSQDNPTQKELTVLSNSQKVLEWLGFYYSECTGRSAPFVSVDMGGTSHTQWTLGDWLIAVIGVPIGFVAAKIVKSIVAVQTGVNTGV